MFRLEYLKVSGHPQLGDLNINLFDIDELEFDSYPYTSVIIGPNGTGKSFILKTIAEILRELKNFQNFKTKSISIPFDFDLQYYVGENQYRIILEKTPNNRKKLEILKNAYNFNYLNRNGNFVDELSKSIIPISELEFPEKLIVNSVMLTDRFVWQNSKSTDFYQYLGVRSTKTTSSTQTSARRTINHLFNSARDNSDFIETLKELLIFLDFDESFKIDYSTKVNKLFFSGSLTKDNFKKYFEYWWDEDFKFSKRKKENPLWSIPYYNNNFKDNPEKIDNLINYLNQVSNEENRLKHKYRSTSKVISINLFDEKMTQEELKMIIYLEKLDIINLNGIKIKKNNSSLSINDISSGEYQLIISLIGIFSSISENSLVLMDEPEISLHPNWQMKYMSFLKKMFQRYHTSQFILSTHSHFLVSDLEGKSSSVTALKRDSETGNLTSKLLKQNTFGWSAEEVLYSVFEVRSTRNSYLEYDLTKLMTLVNRNSKDHLEIKRIIDKISKLTLSDNDPLNIIIEKGEKYISNYD